MSVKRTAEQAAMPEIAQPSVEKKSKPADGSEEKTFTVIFRDFKKEMRDGNPDLSKIEKLMSDNLKVLVDLKATPHKLCFYEDGTLIPETAASEWVRPFRRSFNDHISHLRKFTKFVNFFFGFTTHVEKPTEKKQILVNAVVGLQELNKVKYPGAGKVEELAVVNASITDLEEAQKKLDQQQRVFDMNIHLKRVEDAIVYAKKKAALTEIGQITCLANDLQGFFAFASNSVSFPSFGIFIKDIKWIEKNGSQFLACLLWDFDPKVGDSVDVQIQKRIELFCTEHMVKRTANKALGYLEDRLEQKDKEIFNTTLPKFIGLLEYNKTEKRLQKKDIKIEPETALQIVKMLIQITGGTLLLPYFLGTSVPPALVQLGLSGVGHGVGSLSDLLTAKLFNERDVPTIEEAIKTARVKLLGENQQDFLKALIELYQGEKTKGEELLKEKDTIIKELQEQLKLLTTPRQAV
jgi:hypothetical protein